MEIKLYNEDCLGVLKQLPDECIDLVCTDCPYHICAGGVTIEERKDETSGCLRKRAKFDNTSCGKRWVKKDGDVPCCVRNGKMFGNNDIKFEQWLPEIYRVLKQDTHCYIMINARNLCELQTKAENAGFKFQNLLVWDKGNATPNKWYMQCCEFVLMLRKGKAKNINNLGSKTLLSVPNIIGKKLHPTEKPEALMKILIENSTQPGDLVLDPFMGAGSTGLAAKHTERRFIGCEIDEKYAQIATDRIYGELL